ncbi:MAG: hypothetical protein Q8Q09_00065 [Deltaproteobacteria bacterium]|nr:hypothetical protein [Deltaproteobacteria bacterium]
MARVSPVSKAPKKPPVQTLTLEGVSASPTIERQHLILFSTLGAPDTSVRLDTSGTLASRPCAARITQPCALADGTVLALVDRPGEPRALARISLEDDRWTPVHLPDDWHDPPYSVLPLDGDALLVASFADRMRLGYTGVRFLTGERLVIPAEWTKYNSPTIQAFAIDDEVTLLLTNLRWLRWDRGQIQPVANVGEQSVFGFGQLPNALRTREGLLYVCAGDMSPDRTRIDPNSYRVQCFDRDGLVAFAEPALSNAQVAWGGPGGAMIVQRKAETSRALLTIYWPATRTFAEIPRAWTPTIKHVHDVLYAQHTDALWVTQRAYSKRDCRELTHCARIPWSAIEELERKKFEQ